MSSTKRGGVRSSADVYKTEAWVVDCLMNAGPDLPGGLWLEPCAGTGNIVDAVNAHRSDVSWMLTEVLEEQCTVLRERYTAPILCQSSLEPMALPGIPDVIITNPPFSLAWEMLNVWAALYPTSHIVLLLRLNFLGSAVRADLLTGYPPDVYVLPNRPSFVGAEIVRGKTDSIEYAWMHWGPVPRAREYGRVKVLPVTPLEGRGRGRANAA